MGKLLNKQDKIALVCCSNGRSRSKEHDFIRLNEELMKMELQPIFTDYLYANKECFSACAKIRADELMKCYEDDSIRQIFDVSGGDIANEILDYLDYELISKSTKIFWGFSDLTTIINAIYAKTGKSSVLYQIRNLVYDDSIHQISNFTNSLFEDKDDLFRFKYSFIQGDLLNGIVVGGNIRCLLKLAGTPYWPDMHNKVLLIESLSGKAAKMTTYLAQLKQLGVFNEINGIILGTYTEMENDGNCIHMKELILNYVDKSMPIIYTNEIGHGADSKAIWIGKKIYLD